MKSYAAYSAKAAEVLERAKIALGELALISRLEIGDAVIEVAAQSSFRVFEILKTDPTLNFNMLVDITAIDWLDTRPHRFQVVYHLMNLTDLYRLRIKIELAERDPSVDSVVPLWKSANFLERETWDMYGIVFKGHPDLRRLLLYEEFKGHPLRKDYPVQGKQPRISMRAPEVRNTAVDMRRQPLVQIHPRPKREGDSDNVSQNRVCTAERGGGV